MRLVARLRPVGKWLEGDVSTWKVLVVLSVGALFAFFILLVDFHWWDDRHRDFAGMSPFVLWAALMCAQTALWALALAWLLPSVLRLFRQIGPKEVRKEFVGRSSELFLSTIAIATPVLLLIVVSVFAKNRDYMPGHKWKVSLLTVVGMSVGLVAAWGVWLAHGRLKQLGRHDELGNQGALDTFLELRNDLHRFLGTLGAILGLLILATGAQRRAVLAFSRDADYGYELVLVYGFFFSILVAAVYLPTHLTSAEVGNRIRDAFFPTVPPDSPEWEGRTAKREKLGSMLELQAGPLTQFKASAAILTPLAGSLVGLLLK